jgi:hypothetical protein
MTGPEQDEVFEAYLKRRPVLPALDEKLEPPAAVDEKVLSRAREAIESARAPQRPPRWAVPMALAATILLCLSVVINVTLNTHRPSPNLARTTAARADVKTSALANATAESEAAAGVGAAAAARNALAANNRERRESVSGGIPSGEVVIPRAKVAGTPAPHAAVVADAAPPPGASGPPSDARAPAVMSSADSNAPASPAGALESANIHPASGATGKASGERGAVPAAASAADKAVLMAKETGVAAPQYTQGPKQERAAALARRAAVAAPHPADPKVWLQQIDALRAAGKIEQADVEMRRFKAAFPNYGSPAAAPDLPR